jgi:outer membrane protein assembly factor BamB
MRFSPKLVGSAFALLLIAAGTAAAILLLGDKTTRHESRVTKRTPKVAPKPPAPKPAEPEADWTTYGFDSGRTHVAPASKLRPPYRRLWAVHDPTFFEFPPVVSHGRLYIGTHGGRVLAVGTKTGRIVWQRGFGRCIAASPAVAGRLVYVALMSRAPCTEDGGGGLVALDSASGRVRWRAAAGVVESSPLVVGRTVYVGSWDHHVYALDARTGHVRWRFRTGDRVKAGPAWAHRTIYVGSYDGRMYALAARTGALRWSSEGGRFYATPAVAYGKVYAGATDGVIYAYDADGGRLAWSTPTGSFVYAAAAVWRGTVYVGSYDHSFYALDAETGARRWSRDVGHPISGAPTVLDGLVYFSTCGSCSQYESDPEARHSYAVDARTGRFVWSFPDGEYSPVVSDGRRVYLVGFTTLYGLAAESP